MLPEVRKFFNIRNPLFQFFLYLAFFVLIAHLDLLLFSKNSSDQLRFTIQLITILITGILLYIVSVLKLNFRHANPLNILISSMIVYILIHPTNPWIFFPLTIFFAWIGKYFIKYKNLPMFNPAGFGIFLTYYVTTFLQKIGVSNDVLLVSWWGADMQQYFLNEIPIFNMMVSLLLLFGFLYFIQKYNKHILVSTFFVTFSIIFLLYNFFFHITFQESIKILSMNMFTSFAFLMLIMIPEPKTSPNLSKHQTVIGILGASVLFFLTWYLPDKSLFTPGLPFLTTLLTMNLFTVVLKEKKLLQ
ncbi:hypothetical protein A3H80_02140 [Candidatus Roizmanbacteria bacterium RIFCSPLOWO2_02_FULL_37_19]|uniref:Uncharacterized protein n=1 Tax=Candidatus Roizmanbacteria bacterium RIFCSPHIGHO2_02_FULL_37_24 TaxID=1802037 RepID=A0A1F7H0G0_9BACT|nr:MAG: hypothetical protein A2862_02725 [Candidatus Roizmanbacteria bacterium RIFCSPHIGHO2_01_FULL_38_41]OGK24533.1 MAG: hypothetical protein A3C24_03220 [Candidatus Roizmanbacteria bacterium RIFCSPHIGHO2_02_FULL_37_24]OGK31987.1 MAG: hypothetical protein A3E10_04560 [Candidatus Roizmanbacteria bacterium RIFCSPHIGHO2_12_FULL_37_23]OGK43788.1 MAG: hypothetical protein A2956_04685 [Candidatus Roizmanbacteria bacterium RIFCSPLOWO2_01_FULL_37_57]OGK54342.1 MAG: hypothetical protein A3H80_02140 [Ca